jgi:ParB family chromosome partitioning protein
MENKNRPSTLGGKLGRDVFFGTSADLPKIVELDLAEIVPNPDQPRKTFDEDALRELADSIDRHGLIQPITVKREDDHYLLVAGERRYRAHQLLGRTTVPAIVTEGNVDEIALIENIQREDLDPLETAEALQQMAERHRYTQEELGQVIGKKQATVSQLLKLNELPEPIKTDYRNYWTSNNRPPKSVLIEITRLKSPEEQLTLWEAVKQGGLTVKAARARKTGSSKPQPPLMDQALAAGRKFVRTLESLDPELLATDLDGYLRLTELCNQVRAFADSLPGQNVPITIHRDANS